MAETIADRLEYLRVELRAERISYEELAELQSLAEHIESGDTELLEAAGVPEFKEAIEDSAWIEAARERYQKDGEVEIDDDAKISNEPDEREDGAYVAAWVWVPRCDVT